MTTENATTGIDRRGTAPVEPALITANLAPIGWQSWAGWRASRPDDHTWLWCDLDGIQVAADLPAEAPIATHVWGWRPGLSWLRLRVDDDQVVGARLTAGSAGDLAAERVAACRWAPGEGRVDPRWGAEVSDALRVGPVTLVCTQQPTALTFVEIAS